MENNKTAGIVAVVLAIAIAVGGVVWFVNREDTATTNDSSQNSSQMTEQASTEQKDIVATAAATADLSTLVSAVQAAGLVETLQGAGPIHRTRPQQMKHLPNFLQGTLDTLLLPEKQESAQWYF
jgi:uncharacterized surface protein with fasciclin (FAS1) repeats